MIGQTQGSVSWTTERIIGTGISAILGFYLILAPATIATDKIITISYIFSLIMIPIGLYPVISLAFRLGSESSIKAICKIALGLFGILAFIQFILYLCSHSSVSFAIIIHALTWFFMTCGLCLVAFYYTVLEKQWTAGGAVSAGGATPDTPPVQYINITGNALSGTTSL